MSSTVRLTVRYNSWKTLEDEVKRRMQLPQDDPERMLRPVGLHVMAHGAGHTSQQGAQTGAVGEVRPPKRRSEAHA